MGKRKKEGSATCTTCAINDYIEFKQNNAIISLKDTSYDDCNDEYMTFCEKRVINFDQSKTNYCNGLGLSNEYAASADALCQTDEKLILIEFKNGDFKQEEIRRKAKESVAIISGITKMDLESIREKVAFVLVYNSACKKISDIDKRAIHLANRGNEDFTLFGLNRLRGLYFDKVFACEKDSKEFKKLTENLISI